MNSLNSIILEGNVVRAPEAHDTPKGHRVCTLPIAVNRSYKTEKGDQVDEVSFFDVETWGSLADACSKYCPKGRGIRVVGRLKQDRWKTEEGKSRSKVSIVAEHVEFKPLYHKQNADSAEETGASQETPVEEARVLADIAEAEASAEEEQSAGDAVF